MPDEVKPLQEAADAKARELAETKERLAKLENKDMNFKKLRDMTDAEREKLTMTELELKKRQESLEEEQTSFKQQVMKSHMDDALAVLAGEDEEVRKKIMHNYERIKDDATTKDEIFRKMKDAYKLTNDRSASINPLNVAMGVVGNAPPKAKEGAWSDDLKELGSKFGLKEDDMKK